MELRLGRPVAGPNTYFAGFGSAFPALDHFGQGLAAVGVEKVDFSFLTAKSNMVPHREPQIKHIFLPHVYFCRPPGNLHARLIVQRLEAPTFSTRFIALVAAKPEAVSRDKRHVSC